MREPQSLRDGHLILNINSSSFRQSFSLASSIAFLAFRLGIFTFKTAWRCSSLNLAEETVESAPLDLLEPLDDFVFQDKRAM